MRKRLQKRLTAAEWLRQVLRSARSRKPATDASKKLEVVRAAVRHSFPTGDIDSMLAEIDDGQQGAKPS